MDSPSLRLLSAWAFRLARYATHPVTAFASFNIIFSLWHFPVLYNSSLNNEAVRGESSLVDAARRKYKAALVDEFQDTDTVQYDIFTRIFQGPQGLLFMIGDPKQSIYSFRGADIFSYIAASTRADTRY